MNPKPKHPLQISLDSTFLYCLNNFGQLRRFFINNDFRKSYHWSDGDVIAEKVNISSNICIRNSNLIYQEYESQNYPIKSDELGKLKVLHL